MSDHEPPIEIRPAISIDREALLQAHDRSVHYWYSSRRRDDCTCRVCACVRDATERAIDKPG